MSEQQAVREFQVTFDCADPDALARFWAAALGYQLQAPPPGFTTWEDFLEAQGVPEEHRNDASAIVPPDGGRRVFFQRVPEGKTTKNRVHLDIRAAPGLADDERMQALESECARLVAVGASRLRREDAALFGESVIVMQDPEGNEFCLD